MAKLPIPVDCAFPMQRPNTVATVQCHKSLACQRCGFCLAHCECGPPQRAVPASKRMRHGEVDESQMQLCEKPELHY